MRSPHAEPRELYPESATRVAKHIDIMCCTICGSDLTLGPTGDGATLRCAAGGHCFPVRNGIPRFVDSEDYAASFGDQWSRYARVQLDSVNGSGFSEQRFREITGWNENELRGKLVLDAGCGAGRFAEVVAGRFGADLVAMDLSRSVDVCQDNLGQLPVLVCQGSLFTPPFKDGSFDCVYCIGVIQHTPDPFAAIRALGRLVKRGGQIGLWLYQRDWKSFVGTVGWKYALRPVVSRLSADARLRFSDVVSRVCLPIVRRARRFGLPGRVVMRLLPASSAHLQSVSLSDEDFCTWVQLDTRDMYSPVHDHPQTVTGVTRLLEKQGYENIRRHPHGGISMTATRARLGLCAE